MYASKLDIAFWNLKKKNYLEFYCLFSSDHASDFLEIINKTQGPNSQNYLRNNCKINVTTRCFCKVLFCILTFIAVFIKL